MLYEFKNLIKTYDQRTVLNLEQLSLEKNKILGLLGPNGAGKTTLLEIMACYLEPIFEFKPTKEKVSIAKPKLFKG